MDVERRTRLPVHERRHLKESIDSVFASCGCRLLSQFGYFWKDTTFTLSPTTSVSCYPTYINSPPSQMNYTDFESNYCMPPTCPLVCLVIAPSVCLLPTPLCLCRLLVRRIWPTMWRTLICERHIAEYIFLTLGSQIVHPSLCLVLSWPLLWQQQSLSCLLHAFSSEPPGSLFLILFLFRSRSLIKCSEKKNWWLDVPCYFLSASPPNSPQEKCS